MHWLSLWLLKTPFPQIHDVQNCEITHAVTDPQIMVINSVIVPTQIISPTWELWKFFSNKMLQHVLILAQNPTCQFNRFEIEMKWKAV